MDLGAVLLLLAVILLVSVFISRPFFASKPIQVGTARDMDARDHLRSSLLAEYDRLLNAIQELEFDFTLGKIPEEEYPQQRAGLFQQTAEVLRQLDDVQPALGAQPAEARVEAAVAARRTTAAGRTSAPLAEPGQDEDLEVLIAQRRKGQASAGGFCPRCGKPVLKTDAFCPKCGAALK